MDPDREISMSCSMSLVMTLSPKKRKLGKKKGGGVFFRTGKRKGGKQFSRRGKPSLDEGSSPKEQMRGAEGGGFRSEKRKGGQQPMLTRVLGRPQCLVKPTMRQEGSNKKDQG